MAAVAFDYSVAAVAGVPAANLLAMRGADPQWTVPAGHPFTLLLPRAAYVAPAGAVAGQALPSSTICAALGGGLALPPNAAGFNVLGDSPSVPLFSIPPARMELGSGQLRRALLRLGRMLTKCVGWQSCLTQCDMTMNA